MSKERRDNGEVGKVAEDKEESFKPPSASSLIAAETEQDDIDKVPRAKGVRCKLDKFF